MLSTFVFFVQALTLHLVYKYFYQNVIWSFHLYTNCSFNFYNTVFWLNIGVVTLTAIVTLILTFVYSFYKKIKKTIFKKNNGNVKDINHL